MTKLRKPHSIEFVLSLNLNKLTDEEIKLFTNKSLSHFRKCSDPDDKDHTLYFKDAINPEGQEGTNITDQEKQKIFKAISEVEEKIAKLKISVK